MDKFKVTEAGDNFQSDIGLSRIMSTFKKILAYLTLVIAASCIDPYVPNLKNFKSLLVVEGLITNEDRTYEIRLGRTYNHSDSVPVMIDDAVVFISDDEGTRSATVNTGNGIYRTDSTLFRGMAGRKYTLHIILPDGNEYNSDECPLLPVPGIDSLFYEKGEEFTGDPGQLYTGLKIMLNSSDISGSRQYLRWTYNEDWKFIIPSPARYTYAQVNENTFYFESEVPGQPSDCWKRNEFSGINISTISADQGNRVNRQEIVFIAPDLTDRLTREYSILVTQYSVSEKEYNFWKMLRQVQEPSGDIFGSQPYPNISNVHNVNNPGEEILGYFEVSAAVRKRIFITANELLSLKLPFYHSECKEIRLSPNDWTVGIPPTWNEIYHSWVDLQHYRFVGPVVTDPTLLPGLITSDQLVKLLFTTDECAVCEVSGSPRKPDFWIDLE